MKCPYQRTQSRQKVRPHEAQGAACRRGTVFPHASQRTSGEEVSSPGLAGLGPPSCERRV